MAALTNTDIKSTTLEAGFLEMAQRLNLAEQAVTPAAGQQPPNKVTVSINADTKIATINATLPLDVTVGADGSVTIAAATYC